MNSSLIIIITYLVGKKEVRNGAGPSKKLPTPAPTNPDTASQR